ncbi:MAG TPA: NAD(P)H-dependent oxidoreductase subunit E [Bdellovibrionota bacterium]|jgi:NADH-quinone oxidoreductase subunit E|nr:NAD(P)H-dependent oxidoreductase subunit E [Bdellovibrionota bacterium]
MASYKFSPAVEEKFQWLLSRYPKKDAVLLPILHLAQDEAGYVSPAVMEYVASRLDLSPARVREVASFYTMFKMNPSGKYVLQFCHTLSCYLRGAEDVIKRVKDVLGIEEGETTPDGLFTIERVECLASCGTAPVMQVNTWDFHEELNPEKIEKIVQSLRKDQCAHASYDDRVAEGGIA